jgi:hypothetical protein
MGKSHREDKDAIEERRKVYDVSSQEERKFVIHGPCMPIRPMSIGLAAEAAV